METYYHEYVRKEDLMAVINFEIFKVIGTLSEDKDGWKNN